jgi:hypothetical protein
MLNYSLSLPQPHRNRKHKQPMNILLSPAFTPFNHQAGNFETVVGLLLFISLVYLLFLVIKEWQWQSEGKGTQEW